MDAPAFTPLAHVAQLELLGLAVQFQSDSTTLLDAALAAVLGSAGQTQDLRAPAVTVRLGLLQDPPAPHAGRSAGAEPALSGKGGARYAGLPRDFAVRTRPDGVLEIQGDDVRATASLDDMRVAARLSPRFVQDPAFREILTTLILYLLTRLDRQPVHAAAIANGPRALLLAGPGGAGKSTLAYLAHRAGLRVVADDAVYVQLEPEFRLWGMPGPLHLTADAGARFPELSGIPAVARRGDGRHKLAVRRAGSPAPATASGICILEPGAEAVSLEPISLDEAVHHMLARLDPGFDVFAGTIEARLRAAGSLGTWRLRLSHDAEAAFRVVADLLARL